jgi:hypothetical protein
MMARGIHIIRQELAQASGLWRESGTGPLDAAGLPIESLLDRGVRAREPVDDEWGRSESLDPDNVGDIADEGSGHRG